jgi:hypothetical protein
MVMNGNGGDGGRLASSSEGGVDSIYRQAGSKKDRPAALHCLQLGETERERENNAW